MSEIFTQEPLITEREVLERMSPNSIADLIIAKGEQVSEIERFMNLAGDVLEAYGYSVESILDERNKNDNQT